MTPDQSRRRALLAILDQYPMEREAYLHDGRRMVAPREEFAEKIEALFATPAQTMTTDERREKRSDILENLVDTFTGEDGYALGPIVDALNALDALDTPPLFEQVMTASKTFVERFPGGHLTEKGTVTKFGEEAEEFKEAITDLVIYHDEPRQALIGEAFDVMVTMGGVLAYYGIQWNEVERAMRAGLDKLGSRTTDDYAWFESVKQVAKKSKMGEGQS